jgi:hypothetical protein
MLIVGEWYICADEVMRLVIRGFVLASDNLWVEAEFLVDPGADRTVLIAPVADQLGLSPVGSRDQLMSLGGLTDSYQIETTVALPTEDGRLAKIPSEYYALQDPTTLEMSLLGRDVLDNFALLIDRLGNRVLLANQRHSFRLQID